MFSKVFFKLVCVNFAASLKEGMLFHSVDVVTMNVLSPDLLRVLGMVSNGSREEGRLGRDG